jgi:L-asparaginase II
VAGDIAVRVMRGRAVEAEHSAVVAVVNIEGNLTHYFGDPESIYMTRSSVKPFQALPLILTGGFDHYGFSESQLAIMCASHSGNDEHCEVVKSNLDRAGNRVEDLLCGVHWPIFMRNANLYPQAGEDQDPLRHNCSGKHSGFLALAKYLGEPLTEYLNPDSKTQRLIKTSVAERCEYDEDKIKVGIDGCSAPVFSMPMRNLAIGFKNLANLRAPDTAVALALGRVKSAMTMYPFLVAGEKRFDYDFMRSFPGNGVSKVGAEAIQGIGFSEPAIGICVKITDGGTRALGPVCVHVLEQLGLIDKLDKYPFLQAHAKPEVRNYRNILTGTIEVDFQLKRV